MKFDRPFHALRSKRRMMICLPGLVATAGFTANATADLSADQQKLLAEAQKNLQQAETSLKLAERTAGEGASRPSGSKAKLAMVRLDAAKQYMPKVSERLAKLPADDAQVQALQERYDQVAAALAKLEARLTGKAPSTGAADEAGVKLDYRQEEELKNARYYIREVESLAASLAASADEFKKIEDSSQISHKVVEECVQKITKAYERARLAREHIDALPKDGRGVKEVIQRFLQAGESIKASQGTIAPIHEKLQGLTSASSYPELAPHTDRLRELAAMFANPGILVHDRAAAAELVAQMSAAVEERDRLVKSYAFLIQQQTPEGQRLVSISNHFTKQYLAFSAAAQKEKEALPGQIEDGLNQAREMAAEAVAEKKPLFFAGGIPQRIRWVEDNLTLYEALDPSGSAALKDKLSQAKEQFKKDQVALRDQIIESNALPPDNYSGANRDAVVKTATDAWMESDPDAQILAARIPSQNWKHEVLWRKQSDSWYKVDRSKLQVQLIVRHDDKLAAVQPIDLWKDHLSGDQVKAFPLHAEDYELQPQSLLLLDKVK